MLNFSPAFDTSDHRILLWRLHDMYGIKGDHVHGWFKSYLSDRTQCVIINGVLPVTMNLTFSIPHTTTKDRHVVMTWRSVLLKI